MKRTYQQVKSVVRVNMVSATVCQLKTVVVYWQLAVVKDAKFWLLNPNDYQEPAETRDRWFFCLKFMGEINRLAGKSSFFQSLL